MVRAPAVTEPPVALAGGEKPRRGRKRHLPIYKQCLYPLACARYFPQRGKLAYGFPQLYNPLRLAYKGFGTSPFECSALKGGGKGGAQRKHNPAIRKSVWRG